MFMKKLSAIIFSLLSFLAFPMIALAQGSFTASDFHFNQSTGILTFKATDITPSFSSDGCNEINDFGISTADGGADYYNYVLAPSHPYLPCNTTTFASEVDYNTYWGATFPTDSTNITLKIADGAGTTGAYFSQPIPASSLLASPTPSPVQMIVTSPSSGSVTVGTPFTVAVSVANTGVAFNAARATVTVSDNLTITSIDTTPATNACPNFYWTKEPTTTGQSGPTFAGAILGNSSTGCTLYTMTLTPTTAGNGTIAIANPSIKAYAGNHAELITGAQEGASYTITAEATPTPTPTPTGLPQPVVTSPLVAYEGYTYKLKGTKDPAVTAVYVEGTAAQIEGNTWTWEVPDPIALGDNNVFTVYGSNGTTQTASQTVHVVGYQLGDVDQNGTIDMYDFSSFLVDWDKTENLTYPLSDLSNPPDYKVDLEDLSRLAPLIAIGN